MIQRSPSFAFGRGSPVLSSGLPDWVPASNTLAAIPEANTFASISPGNSGPAGSYSYWAESLAIGTKQPDSFWNATLDAYSGGAYNPHFSPSGGARGSMIYHGGGHGDSNWSGIVAFDMTSLEYSIVKGGTLNGAPIDGTNMLFADGQPLAHHSYDNIVIVGPEAGYSKGALAIPIRQACGNASTNTNAVVIYDFNDPTPGFVMKLAHDSAYAVTPGGAAAYDADLGRIWWITNEDGSTYQAYYALATNTRAKITLGSGKAWPAARPDSQTMRYDSARKLLIMMCVQSGTSIRRVSYFDTTNPSAGWVAASFTDIMPTQIGEQIMFDKAADGTYICYTMTQTSKLYRMTIPATLTDAWTFSEITYTGAAMPQGYIMGKRWSYVPALQSFICKFTGATAHQIYRV